MEVMPRLHSASRSTPAFPRTPHSLIRSPCRRVYALPEKKDYLAGSLDSKAQSALAHLRELTPFTCVLGSYPRDGKLVGPVTDTLDALERGARSMVSTAVGVGVRRRAFSLEGCLVECVTINRGVIRCWCYC